jgi:hypothetical protein
VSSEAALRRIVGALDSADIPFMLTGSFAAAYHGAPRATLDIDIVVDATEPQTRALVAILTQAGQYVSLDAALEALRIEGLFNVIDPLSGWKVDLIMRKDRAFSREEFARRLPVTFDEIQLSIASIEDVILSKLEWARLGGSARQLEDVAALLRISEGDLDLRYLRHWISVLDVTAQWEAAERHARSP